MTKKLKKVYILYTIILLVSLSIDQLSKLYFQSVLISGKKLSIIPSFLELIYVENRGAAFGIFQGGMLFFAFISLLVVCCLTYYVSRVKDRIYTIVLLGVISAGALGNMLDRFIHTFVIDFIHFSNIFGYSFPVFNVADIFLTCGLGLLLLDYLIHDKKDE